MPVYCREQLLSSLPPAVADKPYQHIFLRKSEIVIPRRK